MWISSALASTPSDQEPVPPSMGEAFLYNAGFIILVVVLFYWIFIRPQQQRMQAHAAMLQDLKKGDKVVTGGGLVGTVSKLIDDKEVEIELAKGLKVVSLRSTIMDKPGMDNSVLLNDKKPSKDEKIDTNDSV